MPSLTLCNLDIKGVVFDAKLDLVAIGGRYGLASKDTTPSQVNAVYENLKFQNPKDRFTIGIVDDVTNTTLETKEIISTEPEGTVKCKIRGFGSDGTVGANKQAIKIIGDNTDMYAQAYLSFDSKKSGGVTVSHLRFGKTPIKSTYLISEKGRLTFRAEHIMDLSQNGKNDAITQIYGAYDTSFVQVYKPICGLEVPQLAPGKVITIPLILEEYGGIPFYSGGPSVDRNHLRRMHWELGKYDFNIMIEYDFPPIQEAMKEQNYTEEAILFLSM